MAQLDAGILRGRVLGRERSMVRHLDLTLLVAVLGLVTYGLLMVYSSTHRSQAVFGFDSTYFLRRQAMFLVLGLGAMAVATVLDYRVIKIYAPFVYGLFVILLVAVQSPLGSSALGAQRWFQLAGFQFSPSLFTRLVLVVMLAAYLSDQRGEMGLADVIKAVAIGAVPMLLVFIQPDIGTTIILAAILVSLLVAAGTRARYLVVLALVATLAIFGAFHLHIIKQYQLQRLTSFLDPTNNTQTASYNLHQSEIAIGAGGLSGRGYLQGTQTNLSFVPEQHTDFIFTVVGEELGFLGAMMLLVLFAVVMWRAFRIALLSRDPFGTFVATGVGAMFAIQVFVNVGMTIGIMPITGIPLPFISYGGSALIADLVAVGLLLNIHMRRAQ